MRRRFYEKKLLKNVSVYLVFEWSDGIIKKNYSAQLLICETTLLQLISSIRVAKNIIASNDAGFTVVGHTITLNI